MKELTYYFSNTHFMDTVGHSYDQNQLGAQIEVLRSHHSGWGDADVVIVGCGEQRGAGAEMCSDAPNRVRAALYEMYYWHKDVSIADAGNMVLGETVEDTYSALITVLSELLEAGKKVILIGGSHDLTLAQYKAFQKNKKLINLTVIDANIDLQEEEATSDQGFLYELLTGKDNFVEQYVHLAFQSYLVNPVILQTLERLRFDCVRLGLITEDIERVEPDLRNTNLLSIDVQALRQAEMPFQQQVSPNGLTHVELCELCKFAAVNPNLDMIGFFGYQPEEDDKNIGAKAIAQNIWYLLDGWHFMHLEADLDQTDEFEIHQVLFAENDFIFMKSKRSGRWWMQLPNHEFIPCSYQDFKIAASNELPERWMRYQERIV